MLNAQTIIAGALVMASASIVPAQQHPRILLNAAEIEAIKAKVKAGTEPWKSAAAKTITNANGVLSQTFSLPSCYNHRWTGGTTQREAESRCDYPYDYHRRTAEGFGRAFQSVAMAWHLTGDSKYVTWAVKNVNSWFFNASTYMEPSVPSGTTVGIDASFSGVIVAIDLMWPALDAALQTKLMQWFGTYEKAHTGHRDAGATNRGDWWAAAQTIVGQFVGNNTARDIGLAQMRTRLVGLKAADAALTLKINAAMKAQHSYFFLPDEGKAEETISYNYFDLSAIVACVEAARHSGIDLYNFKVPGDPVSRFEGLMNCYGALKLQPTLYPNYEQHKAARGDRFLNVDFRKAHNLYEVAYSYKPNKVYMDVVNQLGRPILSDQNDPGVFMTATLTHARGAYPLTLSANAQITGMHRRPWEAAGAPAARPAAVDASHDLYGRTVRSTGRPVAGTVIRLHDGTMSTGILSLIVR